jgi:membrane-associated protease RseP (regulator of RpoE activity)
MNRFTTFTIITAAWMALIGLLGNSPARADQFDEIEKQINKELERALQDVDRVLKQLGQQVPGGLPNIQVQGVVRNQLRRFGTPEDARLGAAIEKPGAVLSDQLDLPRGQGMVLTNVKPDSAAAKAGLKTNDILLEINGKSVPSEEPEYYKLINDIKAGTPVDAVVLRKGKKETVKGVTLPEGKADAGLPGIRNLRVAPGVGNFRLIIPNIQGLPGIPGVPGNVGGLAQGMTVERRADGGWTSKYQEGDMAITITGKTADGKTEVSEIEIKDGETTKKYQSVEAVPEKFRDDVKYMIRRTERTAAK